MGEPPGRLETTDKGDKPMTEIICAMIAAAAKTMPQVGTHVALDIT